MPVPAGRHHVGPSQGRLVLRTSREGFAASAGHDLVIELTQWSAEVAVDEDGVTALNARFDMNSLTVREGTGGVKPLTDRDRREIAHTARGLLAVDRNPDGSFVSSEIDAAAGTVDGTLTLLGIARPLRLRITELGDDRYRASGEVTQSDYGIKPYTAFFGALKLRDAVGFEAEVDLSGLVEQP